MTIPKCHWPNKEKSLEQQWDGTWKIQLSPSTNIQLGIPAYLYKLTKSNQDEGINMEWPTSCPIIAAGVFLNNQVVMEWRVENSGWGFLGPDPCSSYTIN